MKTFRAVYMGVLIGLAVIAIVCLGLGNLLIRQDRAELTARDRRILTVICAHVVADEAYMKSIYAYREQRIAEQPALALQLAPLMAAIRAKQDAVASLDHADCHP